MNRNAITYLQVSIDAGGCDPRIQVEHGDGTISIALHPVATLMTAYLNGTPDELLDLAARIVAAVPRQTPTRTSAPCTCRGYDATDPCGHGDTSQGCPRHDSHAFAEYVAELAHDEYPPFRQGVRS